MAVLMPGARDLEAYWLNLRDGADAITEVPRGRWDAGYYRPGTASAPAVADQVYCRRGGFVDAVAEVNVTRFGIMPNSVAGIEPDQLIALHVAAAALADAGGPDRLPDRRRVGVVLGRGGYLTPGLVRLDQRVRTAGQLVRTLGELLPDLTSDQLKHVRAAFTERLGPDSPDAAIGLVPNLAASRVANRLDLRGPAYTVDAACASSLVAVDQAVGELSSGRCDLMLAGGVHHCHDITLWSVFSQLRALSPSERIRPFHRDADGLLVGEGTGVVVLKRLADARRDDDRIYAVIRGTGVASDGRTSGLVNPDPGGQASAVRQAWSAAGLDPAAHASIGLLEAHGTATPVGDAAELATLAAVFGPSKGSDTDRAVIGSVKSMIGHTMPAAGVAGLVKAALAVHHATLLPTLHCDDPHPALAATRFRTLDKAAPWETSPGDPVRRAAVNAFGFGGINAHVVLEEAPATGTAAPAPTAGRSAVRVAEPERVLLLAADGPQPLAALLDADDGSVRSAGLDPALPHPAAGRARLAVVDPTAKRLALARRAVGRGRPWHGRGDVWFRPGPLLGPGQGKLVFVFPGLEGEFAPRVNDVARHFGLPLAVPDGERVGDVGRHGLGVVAVGRLLDAALRRMGVVPDAVAGHSVGEWTAMTAAGLYSGDEVDAFMAGFDPDSVTVPGLAFGAVGAPADRVLDALEREFTGAGLVLSHDNAPGQSMVCGPGGAVEEFVRSFRARGVLGQVLPFRSGFHTPMLAPYLGPIREAARRFRLHPGTVPVWSGTTAAPFPERDAEVRELFVRHLLEPVRLRQLTEALYAAGHRTFVQMGPGQLGSLVDDTLGGRDHLAVAANSPHRGGLAQLRRTAAALWTAGAAVAPALPTGIRTRAGAGPRSRDAAEIRTHSAAETGTNTLVGTGTDAAVGIGTNAGIGTNIGVGTNAGIGTGSDDDALLPQPSVPRDRDGTPSPQPSVRLDLDGALISLGDAELAALRGELGVTRAAPGSTAGYALGTLGERFPAAAELDALLRETADTAAALIAARTAGRPTGTAPPPGPGPAPAPPSERAPASASAPGRAAAASGAMPAVETRPTGTAVRSSLVRVSPETMPYLLDHCFFPQRAGWPDVADRWPVVPATTIVQHLMDAAGQAAPGRVPVAVHGARFEEWLTATPAVDVRVTAEPVAPDRLAMSFGPRARATVELASGYPAPPPARWRTDPLGERAPDHTAAQLYGERWMFHGPAFQGVTELTALGERHIRGIITAPAAPGALLDNVGQILGYWIMATRSERTVVFPVGMREMRFHGPHPAPGTEVACLVRITSLTDTVLEADVQLSVEGAVWAELRGWQDRRFDNDPHTRPVERFPERNTLSEARAGGWSLVHERWPDLASRDLIMRNSLGGQERSEYAGHAPRGRRQWLLGRIAAKDAVRQWLWDHGEGPVFPAELRVLNDDMGRPYVTGVHGRDVPPLDISLAHRAEAGVAIVRPHTPAPGPGIDIEEVTVRDPQTMATVLGVGELRLLRRLCAAADDNGGGHSGNTGPDSDTGTGTGGDIEALWFTRFWAAKEAVAKAEGTGFGGRPRDFTVLEASPEGDTLTVSGRLERAYAVRCAPAANPPGLADRAYVVAWTTGPVGPTGHPHEEEYAP
ncbi:beta-ketoacyl synthase N-terminal-like domain-containing protein [Streptomyces sp. NPDC026665]|uniref:type I polyketide synthase n=1 Tax=Streptomyces sp. NPDC026665 TaxID=3154798 RepID=UPI0033FBB796